METQALHLRVSGVQCYHAPFISQSQVFLVGTWVSELCLCLTSTYHRNRIYAAVQFAITLLRCVNYVTSYNTESLPRCFSSAGHPDLCYHDPADAIRAQQTQFSTNASIQSTIIYKLSFNFHCLH